VLAGGDGTRLQSLTLKISGDERPKQFCPIINEHSLLSQTRARLDPLFHPDRELFVVTRAHETYYREELSNVDDSCVLPQPLNRGTGVAVALAILHILQRDPDAVVVFAPCDHYYSDDDALRRAIKLKSQRRGQRPDVSVLLSHFPPMLSLVKRVGPAPLARVADELADRAQWAGLLGAGYPPKVIISIFL